MSTAIPPPRDVADVAGQLMLELRPEALAQLQAYADLLLRWNATYNLTALRDPGLALTHHLADCLAVVTPLRQQRAGAASTRILDVGSGGGLPGIVLAITDPAWDVTCVDTVGKKAAFVRQCGAELTLPRLHVRHARIEQLQERFDVITSRAFATLARFCAASRHCLSPDGVWMAMKGQTPHDEIAALPADIDVFHVEPLQVPGLDATRCLVWMRLRPAA